MRGCRASREGKGAESTKGDKVEKVKALKGAKVEEVDKGAMRQAELAEREVRRQERMVQSRKIGEQMWEVWDKYRREKTEEAADPLKGPPIGDVMSSF